MSNKANQPKRRLANYYLSPTVQMRYALVNIASIIVGMAALSLLAFRKLPMYIDSAVNAAPIEVDPSGVISYVLWSFVGVTVGVCIFSFFLSIIITHSMVGPVYVFERHIRNLLKGEYKSRINLRKNDEFKDLAGLLNDLATQLENKQPAATERDSH